MKRSLQLFCLRKIWLWCNQNIIMWKYVGWTGEWGDQVIIKYLVEQSKNRGTREILCRSIRQYQQHRRQQQQTTGANRLRAFFKSLAQSSVFCTGDRWCILNRDTLAHTRAIIIIYLIIIYIIASHNKNTETVSKIKQKKTTQHKKHRIW